MLKDVVYMEAMAKERIKENAINVPMPRSLREQIKAEAQRRMASEAYIIREAMLEYFERRNGQ